MKSPDLDDVFGTSSITGLPIRRRAALLRFADSAVDFGREWLPWVLMWAMLSAVVVLFARACIREEADKKAHEARFMAECQQDRKRYECEVMWRSGEDHEHMVPVVIPMAVGR